MATYYISSSGNDANNGLGPDASAATNKPWLTFAKAMNTGSGVVPGDTVYIGPGYYYSGAVVPISGISSAGSPTSFIGDPSNKQGFKDSGGNLLAAGLVWWTTRAVGDTLDGPIAATTTSLITGTTNNPDGLQFYNLCMETHSTAAQGSCAIAQLAGNTCAGWLFDTCQITGNHFVYAAAGAPTAGRNLTIRRCVIFTAFAPFYYRISVIAATADANLNILFESNLVMTGTQMGAIQLGTGTGNVAGGVAFKGNTHMGSGSTGAVQTITANATSTVTPVTMEGNLILNGNVMTAATSGQIIDNGYNRFRPGSATPYSNGTQAGTSFGDIALNIVHPLLSIWGLSMPRNDFLGWTDAAVAAQIDSAWGNTDADIRGRTPRPWGAGASIGCWEGTPIVQDTSSAIVGGGANSAKLTGQGEFSFFLPVNTVATTLAIVTKSTSYGGTTWPSMVVVANGSVGLATDTTVSATSAAQQTITAVFTPTTQGVVEVRCISQSTSVSSVTYFDSVSRSP